MLKSFLFYLVLLNPITAFSQSIAAPGTEGLPILVDNTKDIIVTYLGSTAYFDDNLFLDKNGKSLFIFNNSTPVGTSVDLGSFPIGTELLFRMHSIWHVYYPVSWDFFSGDANRNSDGYPHARAQENWNGNNVLVSFEDSYYGPFVYNDLSFSVANANTSISSVPIPPAILLVLSSLAGLIFFGRHRKQPT